MHQALLQAKTSPLLSIDLRPVGVVHSPIAHFQEMPPEGVAAQIEVFAEYAPGLFRLEGNSHIVIVGWLDQAQRDRLEASPNAGVFSPAAARPAPTP